MTEALTTEAPATQAPATGVRYDAGPALDGLLTRAAHRWPERTAIRDRAGDVSFAELDARVSRFAAALSTVVGPGAPVGLAPVLSPAYPVAFYGTARAGGVVVNVNPMLRGDGLVRLLTAADVRVVLLPSQAYPNLAAVRDRVPGLRAVVLLDGAPSSNVDGVDDVWSLDELMRRPVPDAIARAADPDAVVCVHFTSGTTGAPKAVGLSHRNFTVNAAQAAHSHGLDTATVVLNALPIYHPMHLNEAIWAGSTQVLCPARDPVEAIAAANRYRADMFFALPVQLAHLAADPRLPGLRLDTVRVIRTGGTELKPATARTLSEHFGIPVIQGYGMAETTSLTHSDAEDRPKIGSVGPVVPGTDARIVDLRTGAVLPAGERGEVQVRGPQVMRGYLNGPTPDIDADGWLSTGDVGYVDDDGYLFLVDRIKDVFKHGNDLVSPSEIERVLARHPAVRDCVVVDHPDEFAGAVAYALVVPAGPVDRRTLTEIQAFVNEQVPPYQQIHHIDTIDEIPGAAFGKVQRRAVRDRLRAAQA